MNRIALSVTLAVLLAVPCAATPQEPDRTISPYVLEQIAQTGSLEVLVYYKESFASLEFASREVDRKLGLSQESHLKEIFTEAAVVELSQADLPQLQVNEFVQHVVPNIKIYPTMLDSVEILDADIVWQKKVGGTSLIGEDYSVCIIDSGVDWSSPAFEGKNIVGGNLDCVLAEDCPLNPDADDHLGHGTPVAAIAAATGETPGIATGVNIISLKVYPPGTGYTTGLYLRRAVNWCTAHAEQYNIAAVNLSAASLFLFSSECDDVDPSTALSLWNASQAGVAVAIATGNGGSAQGIGWPSCISTAIPVAATNKDDHVASFSNYSPLVRLFAPGAHISTTCVGGGCCLFGGTSAATPMVAGSLVLLGQFLDLAGFSMTPHEMEQHLFEAGEPVLDLPDIYKRININNAIDVPGDLNGDDSIDGYDGALMLGSWGPCGERECIADLDDDGTVNALDMATLLANWAVMHSQCVNDLDHDGLVDGADLALLLVDWGPCGACCLADLDDDGSVGPNDVVLLLGSWGDCVD